MYLLATNFLGTQRVYRWYVYLGENDNEVLGMIAKINLGKASLTGRK